MSVNQLNWVQVVEGSGGVLEQRKKYIETNQAGPVCNNELVTGFHRAEALANALAQLVVASKSELDGVPFDELMAIENLAALNSKYKVSLLESYLLGLGLHSINVSLLEMMKVDSPIYYKHIESVHHHSMCLLLN